jgi:uncharacterized membrane protein YkvA (DUF1232 family)
MHMSGFLATIQLMMILAAVLFLAFVILLAIPQSRLRDIVLPFVAWSIAALSAAYVISPIDMLPEALLGPFGCVDDVFALITAIGSGVFAFNAQKDAEKRVATDYTKPSVN